MTSRDNFLKGGGGEKMADPIEEFLGNDTDLDELEGAVFEEVDADEDLLDSTEE